MRAPTVPSKDTMSILDWLRSEGRLIENSNLVTEERPEEEDISVLLGEEDKYEDEE